MRFISKREAKTFRLRFSYPLEKISCSNLIQDPGCLLMDHPIIGAGTVAFFQPAVNLIGLRHQKG